MRYYIPNQIFENIIILDIFSLLFFERAYLHYPKVDISEIFTSCWQYPDGGNSVSDFDIGSSFYFMIKNGKLFVMFSITFIL